MAARVLEFGKANEIFCSRFCVESTCAGKSRRNNKIHSGAPVEGATRLKFFRAAGVAYH